MGGRELVCLLSCVDDTKGRETEPHERDRAVVRAINGAEWLPAPQAPLLWSDSYPFRLAAFCSTTASAPNQQPGAMLRDGIGPPIIGLLV